jgi:hypothetical protein
VRELYKTYPADWQQRATDWKNLVAVCAEHHFKDDISGPDTRNYSPSRLFITGEDYPHPQYESAPAAGRRKKKGSIDWDAPFSIPDTV